MPLIDFAILTALAEEFDVMRSVFTGFADPLFEGAEAWYRTQLKGDSGTYQLVGSFQTQMGPLGAQDLTAKVIDRWDPAYIIMVGIAGSFHEEVKLGDVIVSQQVFYFDPGKAMPGGIRYRPQGYPCSAVLIRRIEALRLDQAIFGQWRQEARESGSQKAKRLVGRGLKEEEKKQISLKRQRLREHRPEVHFGTVASGSLVITDEGKRKEILELHGKIIGTEMEGAGLMHATFSREIPIPAIVIKGISDPADQSKELLDKEKCWRDLAKENSSRLALALILHGRLRALRANQFDLDLSSGSPADARQRIPDAAAPGVAFLAFPQLVVPQGPITDLHIYVEAYAGDQLLDIAKLVVEFIDYKGRQRTEPFLNARDVHIQDHLSSAPVGLYLLVRKTPSRLVFTVATLGNEQRSSWP